MMCSRAIQLESHRTCRGAQVFLRPSLAGLKGHLGLSSGDSHWLRVQAMAESAGQTPGHSFLPSKPQVADAVTSLAENLWRHHAQSHSFAPIKQSSPHRMPRKSIMTKLPIWFDSLATRRHDHNVWLSFFIIIILRSAVAVQTRDNWVNLPWNKFQS